jgi:hypothetical protein
MLDLTVFQDIEYLYLTSIKEIEENVLELFFEEAKAGSEAQELEVNNHTFKNLYSIESEAIHKDLKLSLIIIFHIQ